MLLFIHSVFGRQIFTSTLDCGLYSLHNIFKLNTCIFTVAATNEGQKFKFGQMMTKCIDQS